MFNDKNYLEKRDSLSFKEALEIYQLIDKVLECKDEYLHELWGNVIRSALAYSKVRTEWNYLSREEKQNKDSVRTGLHNAFMTDLKAFYRLSQELELTGDWFEKLGSSEEFRKRWGDFAGYVLCIESIRAR